MLPLPIVARARAICDRVRPEWKRSEDTDKKVPIEQDQRWAFAVTVMKWVVRNKGAEVNLGMKHLTVEGATADLVFG